MLRFMITMKKLMIFFSVNRKVNVWFHGFFIALSEDSCHMYTNALTP